MRRLHRLQVVAYLVYVYVHHARCRTGDEQLVAYRELHRLARELSHADVREILHAATHVHFLLRSVRSVVAVPLAQSLTLIVAVPKAAVEDRSERCVPRVLLLVGERAVEHSRNSLLVAAHHVVDVLCAASAPLYLEDAHARTHHAVDEADGLEVLRRHDILVVNLELVARLVVGDGVRTAAYLHALAAVGRASGVGKTHVALAAHSHAQRTVAEHLDAHQLALRSADVLLLYLLEDVSHLVHVQLARQDNNVGKLSVELQSLGVADVELRREVNLYAHLTAVAHNSHVGSYHRRDASLLRRVDDLVHQLHILVVDDGVHGEIALHAVLCADGCYLVQVLNSEMVGRM